MKKKIKFNAESEFPEKYIGISSHFKDIQVVWTVNNISGFNFTKTEDFITEPDKTNHSQHFSVFKFLDDQNLNHFIIANKNQKTVLFPKIKTIDYILISQFSSESLKNIISSLLKSKIITGAFLMSSDKTIDNTLCGLFEE